MNECMFTSEKDDWTTPRDLFDFLNSIFNFDLDPASSFYNHLCSYYFTIDDDGLSKSWKGHTVFCNPPYGRSIHKWVKKAYYESLDPTTTVVLLIPARTDTNYFHDYILGKCNIVFLRGRLRFGNSSHNAPFPSMLCIYN